MWEEPTLHPYPYFNPFTGATHYPDGTREICSGPNNDKCRIIGGNVANNWWGDDERTKNPYPPKLSMDSLHQKPDIKKGLKQNEFDGLYHDWDAEGEPRFFPEGQEVGGVNNWS